MYPLIALGPISRVRPGIGRRIMAAIARRNYDRRSIQVDDLNASVIAGKRISSVFELLFAIPNGN